ncbi:hypothetical protein CLF_106265 [Clonorchis sinensis]|uniref:Uncharacterized protein n=1 Tax=Clonorchis sinensis TaxID=79923 RepID=G7YEW8_CLOSI|nr:hypothetical protein CLF_106265 [Clonorchis sinensis]
MMHLQGKHPVNDAVLKELWQQSLPSEVRKVLSVVEQDSSLAKLAKVADRVHEACKQFVVSNVHQQSTSPSNLELKFNAMKAQFSELSLQLNEVTKLIDRPQRHRGPRSRSHSRAPKHIPVLRPASVDEIQSIGTGGIFVFDNLPMRAAPSIKEVASSWPHIHEMVCDELAEDDVTILLGQMVAGPCITGYRGDIYEPLQWLHNSEFTDILACNILLFLEHKRALLMVETGKALVVPFKSISIPRLDLAALCLAVKVADLIKAGINSVIMRKAALLWSANIAENDVEKRLTEEFNTTVLSPRLNDSTERPCTLDGLKNILHPCRSSFVMIPWRIPPTITSLNDLPKMSMYGLSTDPCTASRRRYRYHHTQSDDLQVVHHIPDIYRMRVLRLTCARS